MCAAYFNYTTFVTIGGHLLGIAIQRWNLHRRLALLVLRLFGTEQALHLTSVVRQPDGAVRPQKQRKDVLESTAYTPHFLASLLFLFYKDHF